MDHHAKGTCGLPVLCNLDEARISDLRLMSTLNTITTFFWRCFTECKRDYKVGIWDSALV